MEGEGVPVNNRPVGFTSSGPVLEQVTNYTIPGILHFIKHEWSRFEKERASWEVERAELQAKIAFLQGERRGYENLMRDLVRRIKMLEYALKQERAKLHKLQHGTDLVFSDMKPPTLETENNNNPSPSRDLTQSIPPPDPPMDLTVIVNQKEESRKILREYLKEVGFPDNVLEARVARINAYKNLYAHNQSEQSLSRGESPKPMSSLSSQMPMTPPSLPPPPLVNGPIANGTDTQIQAPSRSSPSQKREPSPTGLLESSKPPLDESEPVVKSMMGPGAEDRALASFNFLDEEDEDEEDEEEEEEEEEGEGDWEEQTNATQELFQGLEPEACTAFGEFSEGSGRDDMNTEDAMDEFSAQFPEASGMEAMPEIPASEPPRGSQAEDNQGDWKAEYSREVQKYAQHKPKKKKDKVSARPSRSELQRMEQFKNQAEDNPPPSRSSPNQPFSGLGGIGIMRLPTRGRTDADALHSGGVPDERIEVSILGPLAGLSISNESEGGLFEIPATEAVKKWENKYTMRSHFDAVTSVAFHPSDHVLVTGSEDCTLKIWNLQKAPQGRRTALVDVEPVHTIRGHRGAVLCVAMGISGDICFSGGTDTTIRVWQLPNDNLTDPFDVYDPEVHQGVLQGHTDAIWDLAVHPNSGLLLSCAADGTCRLWNHQLTSPQVKLFQGETGFGMPSSVGFLPTDLHQMVASYTAAKCVLYDLETAKPVLNLDSASTYDGTVCTQINKVVAHPTLPIIVTGHENKYIRFYDANTGKVIHSMTAHLDAVTGLAVDPHGLYLLSCSHDGSLRFWNMDSKICIQETTSHRQRYDESICNVACHLTKPYFASAGADGVAKVFV